jgi:hypothetical protein
MSLINEALKKAQRQRGGDSLKEVPGVHATPSGRIERRGAVPKGQMVLLLAAGAVVLVVLSAVVAVFIVNRSTAVSPKPVVVAAKTAPTVDLNAPSPTIVTPVIAPPPRVAETTAPVSIRSGAPEAEISTGTTGPELATTQEVAPAPVSIPPISRAPQADPKIWAFVDAIHVTGVRTSDKVSKVLMNDHVYRVNDYVERTLGLKLTKIQEDMLTFADENGFEYTKSL